MSNSSSLDFKGPPFSAGTTFFVCSIGTVFVSTASVLVASSVDLDSTGVAAASVFSPSSVIFCSVGTAVSPVKTVYSDMLLCLCCSSTHSNV